MGGETIVWEGRSAGGNLIQIYIASYCDGYTAFNFDGNLFTPEILEQAAQAIRDHQAEQERKERKECILVEFTDQYNDPCSIELTKSGEIVILCDSEEKLIATGAEHLRDLVPKACKAYHEKMKAKEAQA